MHMFPFLLAFLFCLSLSKAGDPCPTVEQLKFCTCIRREALNELEFKALPGALTENSTQATDEVVTLPSRRIEYLYTIVTCNVSKSSIALEEAIVLGLNRKLVDKLTIYNVPPENEELLARLPSRWLRNTRIKQIEILNSVLSGDFIWRGNPFDGQEQSLITLTVNNCFLYGALTFENPAAVNTKGLDHLPKVEVVDFSKNHLSIITTSAFQRPPSNLSTILLSHNNINTIDVGAFKMVYRLKTVDLSHNQLETVVRSIFASPAKYLETMDFSWNYIKVLTPDFFVNMPSLKKVILLKNFLYSLPDKPWTLVWKQLTFVDVEGNFIDCDCSLVWLLIQEHPQNTTTTLLPDDVNVPHKVLKGTCLFHKLSMPAGVLYELNSLTKDKLMCKR